jgi:hypothetical protein
MPPTSRAKDRFRLVLVATGVAIVAIPVIIATIVLVPRRYLDSIFSKWGRFTLVTIFFAAYCVKT